MEASKQHRRKIRALFRVLTPRQTRKELVMWLRTYCPRGPAKMGQLPPSTGLGLMSVSGARLWSWDSWTLWQSCGLCLCLSENPLPKCFLFYACVQFEPLTTDKNKSEHSTTKAWLDGPDTGNTVLVLPAMLVLNFTSRKSSYLWEARIERTTQLGKTLTEKSYFFHLTYKKSIPIFHF